MNIKNKNGDSIEVQIVKFYSEALAKQNPNVLFVYGDNYNRQGKGGQAMIRDCKNAIGLATKYAPNMQPAAFFKDHTEKEYNQAMRIVNYDLEKIIKALQENEYISIVFPYHGLGTGLARLKETAPRVYEYLYDKLKETYNIEFVYDYEDDCEHFKIIEQK